jgi:hypothetical protein
MSPALREIGRGADYTCNRRIASADFRWLCEINPAPVAPNTMDLEKRRKTMYKKIITLLLGGLLAIQSAWADDAAKLVGNWKLIAFENRIPGTAARRARSLAGIPWVSPTSAPMGG